MELCVLGGIERRPIVSPPIRDSPGAPAYLRSRTVRSDRISDFHTPAISTVHPW